MGVYIGQDGMTNETLTTIPFTIVLGIMPGVAIDLLCRKYRNKSNATITPPEPSTRKYNFTKNKLLITLMAIVIITIIISLPTSSSDTKDSLDNTSASPKETSETKSEPSTPVIFSVEQASSLLLKPDDFPKDWTAIKESTNGLVLEAEHLELIAGGSLGAIVKMIKITFDVHENESSAQAAFSAKKSEAQTTIDERGISGDKLEDVKKYPLFVWNASPQANIDGVEKWTVVGVYGNITMKVYHEGSMGAPKKNFAVDIAKKQMDRMKSD